MIQLENEEALAAWLTDHGYDPSKWGRDGYKSVAHLWAEIHKGESRLQEKPPRRLVEVVNVLVKRGGRYLIEVGQDLVDGEHRERRRPPSEKMRPGEDYRQAARRCLGEELGVDAADIHLRPDSHRQEERDERSVSYPGLSTRYTLHYVEAEVDGLPDGTFSTVEKATGPGDPVCRHYWRWIPGPPSAQEMS